MYCYSSENLLFSFATKDEDLFEDGFDEIDEDYILELAGQWSLNPESLIGEEEQESVIVEIIKEGIL